MSLPVPTVDLHVHTLASGHAFSTVAEIAAAAAAKGLRGLAVTDHGPALPGGPHLYHFLALRFLPAEVHGVRLLKGVEANILAGGKLDLPDEVLQRLDVVLAGFHEGCLRPGSRRKNTATLLRAMQRPEVRGIVHPGNPNYPVDLPAVAEQAAATGTALEFNNASFSISRRGSADNCRELARLCARHNTPVTLGSDAHFASGVGEFRDALAVLQEAGVRAEQIVNRSLETTLQFFGVDP